MIAFVYYNGVNISIFVKRVKIYKFEAKDSERNTSMLCLCNISKIFFCQ